MHKVTIFTHVMNGPSVLERKDRVVLIVRTKGERMRSDFRDVRKQASGWVGGTLLHK